MKKTLTLFLAFGLAACASAADTLASATAQTVGLPSSPQVVANQTALDETLLTTTELAYKGGRIAAEIYADTGQCTRACATHLRDLNRRGYAAVQAARTAYRAVNAAGYLVAIAEVRSISNDLLTLTGRNH